MLNKKQLKYTFILFISLSLPGLSLAKPLQAESSQTESDDQKSSITDAPSEKNLPFTFDTLNA